MGDAYHIGFYVSDIDHMRVLISIEASLRHQDQGRWRDYHRLESRSLYDYLGNRASILVGHYGRGCSWLKGQLRSLGHCLALMAGVVMDPSLPAADAR
jgi:hypothetical protein